MGETDKVTDRRSKRHDPLQITLISPQIGHKPARSGGLNHSIVLPTMETIMRNTLSKIFAVLLLLGIAQSLSACVVYAERPHPYWHHW